MSELPVVVLDPGHGGAEGSRNRGSSWNRARGPNGLLEKDVAFDLALRVAARLRDHARVEITRSEETNPSLGERAELARRNNAAVFLSLHLNGSHDPNDDETDVYVAPDAVAASRTLAESVLRRLVPITGASRSALAARDLGTLVGSRHAPRTAAVLAEIAHLTNERQASALAEEGYRNEIADALSDAIREHLTTPAVAETLAIGDGGPNSARAATDCWTRCDQHRTHAGDATAPNAIAAARILRETGVRVDANPYVGITQMEIEAVVRAAFYTNAMPELLLALWAKEGSTQSVTSATAVPQATTDANAKSLFRSRLFYTDLGLDHFVVTRYDATRQDNVWDDSDAAAARHETRFTQRVRELVTSHHLSQDIAGEINRELTVTRSGSGPRSVRPSTRFYSLCLILADAFWSRLISNTFPLLPSIPDGLNYVQWNIRDFAAFLQSADRHRREPRHQVGGQPISIEQWALHTTPAATEYPQPRTNAIKFLHYIESYRPLFAPSIAQIRPAAPAPQPTPQPAPQPQPQPKTTRPSQPPARPHGLEEDAIAEQLAPPTFATVTRLTTPVTTVQMDMTFENFDLASTPHLRTRGFTTASTIADLVTRLGAEETQRTAPGNFVKMPMADCLRQLPFFDFTGTGIGVRLRSVICHPAETAHPDRLPGRGRFPVVVIVHGNSTPFTGFTFSGLGPPVTSGGITTRTATPTGVTGLLESHRGFSQDAPGATTEYLQEELAHHGFVSISIDQNCCNHLNLTVRTRGELILKYLDDLRTRGAATTGPLSRFRNRLNFDRVALIGHSRGGDAVVEAMELNKARSTRRAPQKFGIKTIVSIAPTDATGLLNPAATAADQRPLAVTIADAYYLVVYGSHDGDVQGGGNGTHGPNGTGFRYYDRSNSHRAMVFIHGATHRRFNRTWANADPNHSAADLADTRMLTRPNQETLAKLYVVGWLRYTMNADWGQQSFFNGTTANPLGTPVSLQWKFGRDLRIVENCDTGPATTNTIGGAVTPSSVSQIRSHDENDADPAHAGVRLPTFPNDDTVLKAVNVPSGRATVREDIPALPVTLGDVHDFTHLTFRVTKKYPITSTTAISGAALPDINIKLTDAAGANSTVLSARVQTENPRLTRPYHRSASDPLVGGVRNLTKCNLETWRVPLSLFTGIDRNAIRSVEFSFNAAANEPIYIDTISFVKV